MSSKETLRENIEAQDTKLLSIPFPSWINRWANVYFFLAILSPVVLLLFIKQSPYEQRSFSAIQEGDRIMLVSKTSDDIAHHNFVGQQVLLTLAQTDGNTRRNVYGSITAITPDPGKSLHNIYIYSNQVNAGGNSHVSGVASFRRKQVSILEKIFD